MVLIERAMVGEALELRVVPGISRSAEQTIRSRSRRSIRPVVLYLTSLRTLQPVCTSGALSLLISIYGAWRGKLRLYWPNESC